MTARRLICDRAAWLRSLLARRLRALALGAGAARRATAWCSINWSSSAIRRCRSTIGCWKSCAAQRTLVSTKLALPISDEPIHVYLFPTAEKLEAFMRVHYPATARAAGVLRRKRHAADGLCLLGRSRGRGSAARSGPRLSARRRAAPAAVARRRAGRVLRSAARQSGLNRPHVQELTAARGQGLAARPAAARAAAIGRRDDAGRLCRKLGLGPLPAGNARPSGCSCCRRYLQSLGRPADDASRCRANCASSTWTANASWSNTSLASLRSVLAVEDRLRRPASKPSLRNSGPGRRVVSRDVHLGQREALGVQLAKGLAQQIRGQPLAALRTRRLPGRRCPRRARPRCRHRSPCSKS